MAAAAATGLNRTCFNHVTLALAAGLGLWPCEEDPLQADPAAPLPAPPLQLRTVRLFPGSPI